MTKRNYLCGILSVEIVFALLFSLPFAVAGALPATASQPAGAGTPALNRAAVQSQAVMFIENVGQFDAGARFKVQGEDKAIWLSENAVWVTLLEPLEPGEGDLEKRGLPESKEQNRSGVNLKLSFVDANPEPLIEPFDRLETHVSYFLGKDASSWRPDVPVWGGIRYKDLYPGVNLEISGAEGAWNWSLVLQPGVDDPTQALASVNLRIEGAQAVELEGMHDSPPANVQVSTGVGQFNLPLPRVAWASGEALSLAGSGRELALELAGDQVLHPFAQQQAGSGRLPDRANDSDSDELLYSTFLGGSSDSEYGTGIALGSSGNAYVTGVTESTDFPTTPGAFDTSFDGSYGDAFVTKLNATGSALLYSTFLGGSSFHDDGTGIVLDGSENAYVTGYTSSSDFPTTPDAFDSSYGGYPYGDAFVTKLNASGTALLYSTFLGGSDTDGGSGIALDRSGNAYVTGSTESPDFPTTPDAFDTSYGNSSFPDAFVTKLNASGSALLYSTFLGGGGEDRGSGIVLDNSGNAYISGYTGSTDFPTTPGAFDTSYAGDYDAFVTKLNAGGSALLYSTFLGGGGVDWGYGIALDGSGNAYVTGETGSYDFPTTPGAFDTSYGGVKRDAFVTKLDAGGSALLYSTFLGGSGEFWEWGREIALGSSGNAYVTGGTSSSDFPTTPGAFDTTFGNTDAYVTQLALTENPCFLRIGSAGCAFLPLIAAKTR